jgi:hypothetical protein
VNEPLDLPSPAADTVALAAAVDRWLVDRLKKGGIQRAKLERDLPKELAGDSAFRAVDASLMRLRNAGQVRLVNNRFELAPVKP